MTDQLTLTFWTVTSHVGDSATRWTTLAGAQAERDTYGGSIDKIEHTYRVGTLVRVSAFGAMRDGVVTQLGKTRVRVEFARNRQGTTSERWFHAWQLTPRPSAGRGDAHVITEVDLGGPRVAVVETGSGLHGPRLDSWTLPEDPSDVVVLDSVTAHGWRKTGDTFYGRIGHAVFPVEWAVGA